MYQTNRSTVSDTKWSEPEEILQTIKSKTFISPGRTPWLRHFSELTQAPELIAKPRAHPSSLSSRTPYPAAFCLGKSSGRAICMTVDQTITLKTLFDLQYRSSQSLEKDVLERKCIYKIVGFFSVNPHHSLIETSE